jgi:Ca2+-binding RTX toxin-like protein
METRMPEAEPTPNEPRTYVAPDSSGTARGGPEADDIFATADGQTLIGGGGDDIFHIGTHSGLAIEESEPGISTVATYSGTYVLPDSIDNLAGEGDYAHHLTGNAAANVVTGAGGDDLIDGGAGADRLVGGTGADTFVIARGDGSDTIADFEAGPGPDVVRLVDYGYGDFATVMSHMTQDGSTATLDLGNGESLVFENTFTSSFAADDFQFEGATPTPSPTPAPTPAPSGEDTLVLRVSEDAWNGDAQFTIAVDGHQVADRQTATASHAAGEWQNIALAGDFGEGPHQVTVSFVNDAWGGTQSTDRNLYVDYLEYNGTRYEAEAAQNGASNGSSDADDAPMMTNGTLTFAGVADGSPTPAPSPTPVSLVGDSTDNHLVGGAGNDTLQGDGGNDTLEGGAGSDTLIGGNGDDTLTGGTEGDLFVVTKGEGSDVVTDFEAGAGPDFVRLYNYGFTDFQSVMDHMTQNGSDAVLDLGGGETLTFKDTFERTFAADDFQVSNSGPPPEADPTPTPDEPRGYVAAGADGTAHGTSAAESIYATGDNQTLVGGGGDDIFHIGTHTGLTIQESDPGISAVSTYLTSYVLPDGVDNLSAEGAYAHHLAGNGGANVINGNSARDFIHGDTGNDALIGGGGDDTFFFQSSDGNDTVLDFSRDEGDQISLDVSLSHIGHIDNFAELQHWIEQDAITMTTTADSLTLNFGWPPDVLTIHGINNLQQADWTFAGVTS